MIDGEMGPIALNTFSPLNSTNSCYMTPFPVILVLQDIWIHVCTMNSSDNAFYIELSIDDLLSIRTILGVPNIDPDNCYI